MIEAGSLIVKAMPVDTQKDFAPISLDRLHAVLVGILATPDAKARPAALGADAQTNRPQEFAQAVARETAKWARIVKESGARAE